MTLNFLHRGRHAALSCFFLGAVTLSHAADQVVVIGSREPLAASLVAGDVVVIDAATLRETRADSLADLLRREAGVQLSRSGGPGQSTGIFLRGSASQQSVVLVDGVRVGSATLGFAALESLGLAEIERIEVLRGPGSSLYGADAVGGVVQVFTRRGAPGLQVDGTAAVGGYGSRELSATVRGASGPWDAAASLSRDKSRGKSSLRPGDAFGNYNPDKDGFQRDSAQLGLGWRPASGHRIGLTLLSTRLDSQYDGSEFLPPTYAQNNTPDFRTKLDTDVAGLDWQGDLGAGLKGSARVSRSVDDARNGGSEISRFRTVRRQAQAQLAGSAGLLGRWAVAAEQGVDRATADDFAASVERRNDALVGEITGSAGAWAWQTDLRRDDSSDFGGVTTGRVGGSFALLPGLRLRALAGTTFRAPSFNDLYYPGYGVATLQPERGRSIEFGLSWRDRGNEAAATAFRNRVRDLVGYQSDRSGCPPDPAYNFGCAANISRARLEGLTLSGARRSGALALRAQVDFLEARDEITGKRLPRRAAHQATLAADWTAGAASWGASVLRVGARPDGGKTLAAETTLDLSAAWQFAPAWRLQAKLLNATDRETEPARDYQGLGRQAWLLLRYGMP